MYFPVKPDYLDIKSREYTTLFIFYIEIRRPKTKVLAVDGTLKNWFWRISFTFVQNTPIMKRVYTGLPVSPAQSDDDVKSDQVLLNVWESHASRVETPMSIEPVTE
jgi:hypothetical protein